MKILLFCLIGLVVLLIIFFGFTYVMYWSIARTLQTEVDEPYPVHIVRQTPQEFITRMHRQGMRDSEIHQVVTERIKNRLYWDVPNEERLEMLKSVLVILEGKGTKE